jgi:uncharacterized protein YdeI (YjbR/CyaY-like superfamily)
MGAWCHGLLPCRRSCGVSRAWLYGVVADTPIIAFASRNDWEEWLAREHATSQGLWLKLAKRGAGVPSVSYPEAVEAALCFGWIDGQKRKFDDVYWLQRFTPRSARSRWSKLNRQKATELIAAGRMRRPGLAEVERAKSDGRWEAAYEPPSSASVPEDLQRELNRNERARRFFETLNRVNRYAILHRIEQAKRPETRARRIEKFVTMLDEGKKLYP